MAQMSFIFWDFCLCDKHTDLQWCPLTVAPRYPVLQKSAGSPQLRVSTARTDQARGKCQISRCLLSIESFLNSL